MVTSMKKMTETIYYMVTSSKNKEENTIYMMGLGLSESAQH